MMGKMETYSQISRKSPSGDTSLRYLVVGVSYLKDTPHIQQYLLLRSEFMGYLYAITRNAELSEEVYQNAAVVVIEKADQPEAIRDFRAGQKRWFAGRHFMQFVRGRFRQDYGRAMSPELLEAVSDAFMQDDSENSVVRDEARALRKCLDGLSTDKRN